MAGPDHSLGSGLCEATFKKILSASNCCTFRALWPAMLHYSGSCKAALLSYSARVRAVLADTSSCKELGTCKKFSHMQDLCALTSHFAASLLYSCPAAYRAKNIRTESSINLAWFHLHCHTLHSVLTQSSMQDSCSHRVHTTFAHIQMQSTLKSHKQTIRKPETTEPTSELLHGEIMGAPWGTGRPRISLISCIAPAPG